jgi:hypothetical protein
MRTFQFGAGPPPNAVSAPPCTYTCPKVQPSLDHHNPLTNQGPNPACATGEQPLALTYLQSLARDDQDTATWARTLDVCVAPGHHPPVPLHLVKQSPPMRYLPRVQAHSDIEPSVWCRPYQMPQCASPCTYTCPKVQPSLTYNPLHKSETHNHLLVPYRGVQPLADHYQALARDDQRPQPPRHTPSTCVVPKSPCTPPWKTGEPPSRITYLEVRPQI